MNIKIIIEDLYKNRPIRFYTKYAPALRSERYGLKVMSCKEFGKLVNKESINVVGNYSPSGHDASRIVHPGGVAPTVKENHGTVTATLDMVNVPHTEKVGNIYPSGGQNGNVYSPKGVSPTIASGETSTKGNGGVGSSNAPKIIDNKPFIVASRGRNPENPSDRSAGIKLEQRLEPNSQGLCNTLTSVQKDNYVAEPLALDEQNGYIRTDGTVGTLMADGSSPKHNNRVIEPAIGIAAVTKLLDTDLTMEERHRLSREMAKSYRIRKLTPKECWRLMAFADEDFNKAQAVCSNTQLYKQAGNSIVVNVLMAIFWELLL